MNPRSDPLGPPPIGAPSLFDVRQAEVRRDRWLGRAERARWPWLHRLCSSYAEQAELIRIEALERVHLEVQRN